MAYPPTAKPILAKVPRATGLLEATCITKRFGLTAANVCLSLSIHAGEILGVLGENGAGKSTLLSILSGMTRQDSGRLVVDGVPTAFGSPRDARRAGVSSVFQHFALVSTFSVREQLRLAGWSSPELPPLLQGRLRGDELISQLSLGERQLIEIAKALISQPRILLLDEPTSLLTISEAQQLFGLVRDLRNRGTSVVFVTHKLHEAMELCDRIVVLRHGQAVGSVERPTSAWPVGTDARLLKLMFGTAADGSAGGLSGDETPQDPDAQTGHPSPARPASHFHVHNVTTTAAPGRRPLRGISFDVHGGDICAIVGVDGQGQRELAEVCAGYADAAGKVMIGDQRLSPGDPTSFRHAGIAYLTDDRTGEGTVAAFSIEDNLIAKRQREWPFSRAGMLRRREIRNHATKQIAEWHIHPPLPVTRVATLSGGNIQKVLLARELSIASRLLIANKPSQGLDARTQELVWGAIRQFSSDMGLVLLFLTDIDEALAHATRIAVMYDGAVSPMVPPTETSRPELERMMVTGWS